MYSGKSWAANALAKEYNLIQLSFARALKEEVVAMGFSREDVYVNKPPHIRALLQALGCARRAEDPDYWVKKVQHSIHLHKPNSTFIIDDVRFMNEALFCEEGGTLIRLERTDYDNTDAHESEVALDDYPFVHTVFAQSGELDELVAHVDDILWVEGVIG